jgi:phosphoribosyl-ATP pyrophosphohydrolase
MAANDGVPKGKLMSDDTLALLAATIAARRTSTASASYTKSLLDKGVAACAKKLGEEAAEAVIAAVSESDERFCSEAADLIYHLLVLMEARNIPLVEVLKELDRRAQQSGHAEKASRTASGSAS